MNIIAFLLLIINVSWTVFLYLLDSHSTLLNYLYNLSYGLNFIVSAFYCFIYLKKCPLHRTSLFYFLSSFITFSIAQLIWIYYNVVAHTEIPYPGSADIFWVLFYPLIAIGFANLLKEIGSPLKLSNYVELGIISSIIFLILSTFLALDSSQLNLPFITKLLNYTYPIADSLLIGFSIITLRSQVGHLNPKLLYFIFGFALLTVGDTLFAHQTATNSYWNGNIADLAYAISGYFILMGVISLKQLFTHNNRTI